jgi:hypothetical protein
MEQTVIHSASVQLFTGKPEPVKNTVTFLCNYKKDYTGNRIFEEGKTYELAADAADYFEGLGVGHLLDEGEQNNAADEPVADEPVVDEPVVDEEDSVKKSKKSKKK